MPKLKIALLILLFTFLSGQFTLNRLNLGFSLEIRFILCLILILVLLASLKGRTLICLNFGSKKILLLLYSLLVYFFFSTISLFYTLNQNSGISKLFSLLLLLLLIISVLYIVNFLNASNFFSFITVFFIIIGVIYAIPIYLSVLSGGTRGEFILSGPNVATRILFFAVCSSLYRYMVTKKNVYVYGSLLFFVSIILVGSRGGLVGAIVVFGLMFFIRKILVQWKIKKNFYITYKQLLLFPIGIGILLYSYGPVKRVVINRIIDTTFGGEEQVYTAGRDIIYSQAIEMIKRKPIFGFGIDSFTSFTGQVYPHNLLLEMMVEVGVIGAIIFFIFVLYAVLIMFKLKRSPLFVLSGLPLYMVVVQMFSGEFYDFRYFFLWVFPLMYYQTIEDFKHSEK